MNSFVIVKTFFVDSWAIEISELEMSEFFDYPY